MLERGPRRRRGVVFVLAALPIAGRGRAQPAIAFTNVAVVDVEKGVLRSGQTVVIEGARIVALDGAGLVQLPRGARLIGGKEKFLMPGLCDTHVHEAPSPSSRPRSSTDRDFSSFNDEGFRSAHSVLYTP